MNNKGVLTHNTVRPASSADTFPIVFSNEIKGGLHTYITLTDRDNIPSERRQEGMSVYVNGRTFYLSGGTSNSNWVERPTNIDNLSTNQFSLYDGIDSNGVGRFKGLASGSNISILDGPSGLTISTIGSMSVNLSNEPYNFSIWSGDTLTGATRQAISNELENLRVNTENGLTKIGNNIQLGGTLINNTLIDGDFDLTFKDNKSFNIENLIPPFNSGGTGFNSLIFSIELLSDGKILVGGQTFDQYNSVPTPARLVRLNSDGTIDNTFNSGGTGFNSEVSIVKNLLNNDILVGGSFTQYNDVSVSGRLVRLNPDGSLDNTFNSGGTGFNATVLTVKQQSDDKILVGGEFTTYNGISVSTNLIRLNHDGSLDNTFNSGGTGFNSGGVVRQIIFLTDSDKILVGGDFSIYNGVSVSQGVIRLNSDGTIDNTFNSGGTGFNGSVTSLKIDFENKILVGGSFEGYNGSTVPRGLVRLNSDGSIDNTFNNAGSGVSNAVISIETQPDNKIIVGGDFTTYNGISVSTNLIRLNHDGSLDNTFNSGGTGFNSGGVVRQIIFQPHNNKILVGGGISLYNGSSISVGVIRLNPNGVLEIVKDVKIFYDKNSYTLKYNDNYHSFYTDRSLVDKEFVMNLFNFLPTGSESLSNDSYNFSIWSGDTLTGATRQAISNELENLRVNTENGLSNSGSTVRLGGTLINNTLIDINDNWFEIKNDNSDYLTRVIITSSSISLNLFNYNTEVFGSIEVASNGIPTITYGNDIDNLYSIITLRDSGILLSANNDSFNTVFITTTLLTDDRNINFPDQSGVLALVENLTQYLPLSGGVMTGTIDMDYNSLINTFSIEGDEMLVSLVDGEILDNSNKIILDKDRKLYNISGDSIADFSNYFAVGDLSLETTFITNNNAPRIFGLPNYDFIFPIGSAIKGETLIFNGSEFIFDSVYYNIITVSGGTYNVTSNNLGDVLNVTTVPAVITLPSLSTVNDGFYIDIACENIPTTINADIGEQIDGVASVSSVGYGFLTIIKLSSTMWRVK